MLVLPLEPSEYMNDLAVEDSPFSSSFEIFFGALHRNPNLLSPSALIVSAHMMGVDNETCKTFSSWSPEQTIMSLKTRLLSNGKRAAMRPDEESSLPFSQQSRSRITRSMTVDSVVFRRRMSTSSHVHGSTRFLDN